MALEGYLVTEEIQGAHRHFKDYPLLKEDLIVKKADGTWYKEGPGIGIGGFELSAQEIATLKPVKFESRGLLYRIIESDS